QVVAAFVGLLVLIARASEEARRGQLLGVTDHDGGLASREGAYGVTGRYLRRLVEDDDVEDGELRTQVLCDRDGAHEKARLEPSDQRPGLGEQRAHGLVPSLLLRLAPHDADGT